MLSIQLNSKQRMDLNGASKTVGDHVAETIFKLPVIGSMAFNWADSHSGGEQYYDLPNIRYSIGMILTNSVSFFDVNYFTDRGKQQTESINNARDTIVEDMNRKENGTDIWEKIKKGAFEDNRNAKQSLVNILASVEYAMQAKEQTAVMSEASPKVREALKEACIANITGITSGELTDDFLLSFSTTITKYITKNQDKMTKITGWRYYG